MTTTFDAAKCQQRNRLAARRDGVEAQPLVLFASVPPLAADDDPALRYAHGTIPQTDTAVLMAINAGLPADAPPLTLADVWVHYFEAANNTFIPDRYAFMDGTTLRNIGKEAAPGVAFMNSHRNGGLSHPADLPMGRTLAGRFEEYVTGQQRAVGAFYMLRGIAPNGPQGPTTDDLHRMIAGGTVADVSVGLYSGDEICDVCGNDVNDYVACKHSPGTTMGMTAEEIAAQVARGVTKGRASYTIVNGHLSEVSAVYDGAVPGAGFRKTLALARRHQLSRADLLDASQVYARLLRQGDLPMDDIVEAVERGMSRALARFTGKPQRVPGEDVEDMLGTLQGLGYDPPTTQLSQAPSEPLLDRAQLERDRVALEAEKRTFAQQQHWARAEQDVAALIHDGFVRPAQNQLNPMGKPELTAVLAAILGQDSGLYTRLLACYRADTARPIDTEAIPAVVLPSDPGTPTKTMAPARKRKLLAFAGAPIQGETDDAD